MSRREDTGSNTVEDAARFEALHAEPVDDDIDPADANDDTNDDEEKGDPICCTSPHCGCGGYSSGVTLRRRGAWRY